MRAIKAWPIATLLALAPCKTLAEPPPLTVDASTSVYSSRFEKRISFKISDGPFKSFFDEITKRTRLEFGLTEGLDKCRISAFIRELPAREALQMMISERGIRYEQQGRSNFYLITRAPHAGLQCPPEPKQIAAGSCRVASPPISLECRDGKLSELASLLSDQSGASIVVWNDAIDRPVSLKLKKDSLFTALKELIRRDPALNVRQMGTSNRVVLSVDHPAPGL